jgi:DNA topoisomerase I
MTKKQQKHTNLLIVESPAKAKTINKYLGSEYKVMATIGHIIDLPKSKLGVDVEKGYKPLFETIHGKGEVIQSLKRAVPKKGNVYLAMDPDREGEAIAWHVSNTLKLKNAQRVTFHEITEEAIKEAVKKAGKIDLNLVEAQKARRVLDRLVGYKLSELIWQKIWYGLSAGRVQSVALRLVVEKEEEREAFKSEEYWEVYVNLKDGKSKLIAKLSKKDGEKYIPLNEKEVKELEKKIGKSKFIVKDITRKEVHRHAYPPFTTSTLQQASNNIFGYSSKRTMALAQQLYQSGYITYMRTDSYNLSSKAINAIRDVIKERYGDKYLPEKPNYYKTRSKNAQEAHEAIRPTNFNIDTLKVKADLGNYAFKIYELIWKRAVASQMNEKKVEVLNVSLVPKSVSKPEYIFTMGGEIVLFDGFRKVLGSKGSVDDLQEISKIEKDMIFDNLGFNNEQKYTQAPARYTEASLIKKLELLGIGRPSTYATIISTIMTRGYVKKEEKALYPTEVGRIVTNFLRDNFKKLVDYKYTAKVEDELDDISLGKKEYIPVIDEQYKSLIESIGIAKKNVKKDDVVILGKSDEKCPICKGGMVIRLGRYGKFLSCSKFPECKGMTDLEGGEDSIDLKKYLKPKECPKCKGEMVLKNSRFGKFWACKNYPDCKGTLPLLLNEKCPECSNPLVERRSKWGRTFIGCSNYPDCKYIKKKK